MTALAGRRGMGLEIWDRHYFTLSSGTKAYHGGTAAIVRGSGEVVPATGALNQTPIGLFARDSDATDADAPVEVELFGSLRPNWRANDTETAVVAADLGAVCYVLDDQTVTMDPAGNCPAGIVLKVDANDGVLVAFFSLGTPLVAVPLVGAAGAYATNNWLLTAAEIVNGAVYKVPETAAASTISLPTTGVAAGTTIVFVANGTANGHTVTYREGTTAISAALTASVRHRACATFDGSKWAINTTVSP